jgi:lysozyme
VKTSSDGLDFIKKFEKFVPFIYDDFNPRKEWDGSPPKGTLTIGYGHTKAAKDPIKMTQGLRITEPQASDILLDDLGPAEDAVNGLVKVTLKQHQFDALVSFKFNTGRLAGTGLLTKINARAFDAVPSEFMKWVRSKGQVLQGLKNRRQGEIDLWNKA